MAIYGRNPGVLCPLHPAMTFFVILCKIFLWKTVYISEEVTRWKINKS